MADNERLLRFIRAYVKSRHSSGGETPSPEEAAGAERQAQAYYQAINRHARPPSSSRDDNLSESELRERERRQWLTIYRELESARDLISYQSHVNQSPERALAVGTSQSSDEAERELLAPTAPARQETGDRPPLEDLLDTPGGENDNLRDLLEMSRRPPRVDVEDPGFLSYKNLGGDSAVTRDQMEAEQAEAAKASREAARVVAAFAESFEAVVEYQDLQAEFKELADLQPEKKMSPEEFKAQGELIIAADLALKAGQRRDLDAKHAEGMAQSVASLMDPTATLNRSDLFDLARDQAAGDAYGQRFLKGLDRQKAAELAEIERERKKLAKVYAGLEVFTTFSGSDVEAMVYINSTEGLIAKHLQNLQTVSFSTFREKQPVRALGYVTEKGKTRGTRTIAGSFVFTLFDRDAFFDMLRTVETKDKENPNDNLTFGLADQLPKFDLILHYANEYGAAAEMALYGIDIMSTGQVVSVENMITEQTVQFTAQHLKVMRPGGYKDTNLLNFSGSNASELLKKYLGRRAKNVKANIKF
jgi:hypothetical protein